MAETRILITKKQALQLKAISRAAQEAQRDLAVYLEAIMAGSDAAGKLKSIEDDAIVIEGE